MTELRFRPKVTRGRLLRAVLWLLILGVALVASLILFNNAPQIRNMRAVDEWIAHAETQAAVTRFQQETGLTFKFFTGTRHQGSLGIRIEGESAERREEIVEFVKSLNPPRPIDLIVLKTTGTFPSVPPNR